MKIILSTLLGLAVTASRVSDHDGTFYEEYHVNGHSHSHDEDKDDDAAFKIPSGYPSRPDFDEDDAHAQNHHRPSDVDLGLGNDEVADYYN